MTDRRRRAGRGRIASQWDDVRRTVGALAERLDETVAVARETAIRLAVGPTTVDALEDAFEGLQYEVTDLRRRLDGRNVAAAPGPGVDAALADLDARIARLARVAKAASESAGDRLEEHEAAIAALDGNAEAFENKIAGTIALLESEATAASRAAETLASEIQIELDAVKKRVDGVENAQSSAGRVLSELSGRLEAIERDRQAIAADAARAEIVWAEERAALVARLDSLAAAMTGPPDAQLDAGALVEELAARLERIEHERESAAGVAALVDTWSAELSALEARVDERLSTLAATDTSVVDTRDDAALEELAARVDTLERGRDEAGAELRRTAEVWAAERVALHERVAELAASVVTGPVGMDGVQMGGRELDQLRIGLEGLRMRLAYHERTVAELAGSGDLATRVEEMNDRLDKLQAALLAAPGIGGDEHGAASAQVLGLLDRVERAERTVRDDRDTLLERFERIASRIDWRLQRLESGELSREA
jgi:chromosome segregation ATPase